VKAEPMKCVLCIPDPAPRAQELASSSAQKNEPQKKVGLLNCEDRCGIGRATRAERKKITCRAPALPVRRGSSIRVAPATVSAGRLWEMRSAIVARLRDRNSMEIADDLGHRFGRLLPRGRSSTRS